jgi:hypothetical protein
MLALTALTTSATRMHIAIGMRRRRVFSVFPLWDNTTGGAGSPLS